MPSFRASRSKTSMKVVPMIARFFSGSTASPMASRKSWLASTKCRLRCETELLEHVQDLLALVLPHQPVVHVEQVQPLRAQRHAEQLGRHGGVDAAGSQQKDRPVSHLLADALDLLLDVAPHAPRGLAPADAQDEVGDHLVAVNRVVHLGMKLEAVAAQPVAADGGVAVLLPGSPSMVKPSSSKSGPISATESKWLIQTVSWGPRPLNRGCGRLELHLGQGPFPAAVHHLAAVVLGDLLVAEAEAQDGDVEVVDRLVVRRVLAVGGEGGAAREDDPLVRAE